MRPCFGDYMGKTCQGHHGCPHEGECFEETSEKKGACDCPHKRNCHLIRQYVADKFKREHGLECDFIKYFERRKEQL